MEVEAGGITFLEASHLTCRWVFAGHGNLHNLDRTEAAGICHFRNLSMGPQSI